MSVSRVLDPSAGGVAPRPAPVSATLATARALRPGALETNTFFLQPLVPIATACAVALLTLLAILFGAVHGVVVLWLANALAATVWVRSGKGLAYDLCFGGVVVVGVVTGELLTGYNPVTGLVLAFVNVLEIAVSVALMRRFAPGQSLASVRSALIVMGVAGLVAPFVGAVVGALALVVMKGVPLMPAFQVWWLGHALGMMLVAPIVLSINRRSLRQFSNPARVLEWVGLLAALAVVAYAYHFLKVGPIAFIMNMMLVVIAARLRFAGIGMAMLVMALILFGSILYGPPSVTMPGLALEVRIMSAQATLLSIYLPFMLVAALLTERDGLSARARAGQQRAELASESKSRLLANVAHEIKSPVAGVIGIGELWQGGQLGPVNATQKEMAGMLVKTARQVEALAHDLLDVARAESGSVKVELRPTDVVGVLEDVCRATAMRPDAQGLKITVESEAIGLVALVDSQRLTQVIDNLATNAVKYGASGGVITFRAMPAASGVRVEVSDQGPGLTSEKQAQLFEPFNRLGLERSTVEGHGIGLALAKRMVELQGGSIGVVSAPGEGATFWVELPAA